MSKPSSRKQGRSSSPLVDTSSGPESAIQPALLKGNSNQPSSGSTKVVASFSYQPLSKMSQPDQGQTFTGTSACAYPPHTETGPYEQISDDDIDRSGSISGSDDTSYREMVWSVRSYMGWHHIPTFETNYSEPDKSNNPWKGNNPRKPKRISVAMPPDDWLCQKLERLNLTVAEGYPSRSQDSAGLKRDQFIKVPKSQSKWYTMHLLKPEGLHRRGCSVFNWRNTESKVNSQFPRITRVSAYPSTGPPLRPISQESLRRWERAAREDSYIINHAAGFSRCSAELQDKMSQNISRLSSRLNKGKAPKEVTDALNDLHDLMAFRQRVSVAMGTSHQHLADSLFVDMSNLILLRWDFYLDFVKPGVKQDIMNILRNTPMFGYGLS